MLSKVEGGIMEGECLSEPLQSGKCYAASPCSQLAGLAIMKTKNQKQRQLLVGKGCVRKTSKLLCIIRLCLKMFKLVLFFFTSCYCK